ncbi:hypothetical protein N431DRAFT_373457 [Stipitochalara longipes BDJ]|nr:hypothetical protein N431DRAFT_373457 [Stipitochalara longipes BDJ]
MQFTSILLTAAVFALAHAQGVEFTMNSTFFGTSYTAGSSVLDLTWDQNSGPVTLKLMNGAATNLTLVNVIETGVTGTSFEYKPPADLAPGLYAFEIDDSSSKLINYSKQFTLTGGSASSTTSASSTSSATPSPTSNSTTVSTTKSTTKTTGTSSPSPTSSTTTPKLNSASNIASPFAIILLALAAMFTLN